MFLRLAWRNIWRNRKRSLISIASVLFAVVIAMVMRSMQVGFYTHSINNVVSFYTGYIQVHAPGYWERKSVDRSFTEADSPAKMIGGMRHVVSVAPRLETFALASAGNITDGAMIVGIEPETENRMTNLKNKLVSGQYLTTDDSGVLLAEGMARHLQLTVGDSVVVLGQGYHGTMAMGKYPITGVVKFPTPELNTTMIFMTVPAAQELTGAYDRLTSLAVMLDNEKQLDPVLNSIRDHLGGDFEVMSWKEILPELVQYIQIDNASGLIMLYVVYMVIAFGVLGTVLMMTMERTREFGMLMSVGMKRGALRKMIVVESVMLTFSGVVAGVIVSIPIILRYHANPIRLTGEFATAAEQWGFEPIMPFSLDPHIFFTQAVTVLIIAIAAAIYPIIRVSRLDPVTALRRGG